MSSAASSDPRDQKVANAKSEGSGHLWIFRGLAKIDKLFSQGVFWCGKMAWHLGLTAAFVFLPLALMSEREAMETEQAAAPAQPAQGQPAQGGSSLLPGN